MKKSTKYLLYLIGAFLVTAIIYPIILHWVPQESYRNEFEMPKFEVQETRREIPLVDASIASIDLSEISAIQNVVIKGVESPKEQQVYIYMNNFESGKYIDAVDIRAEESKLLFKDLNEETESIDSLVISIATNNLKSLNITASQRDALKLSDIKADSVEIYASNYDISVNDCSIAALCINSWRDVHDYADINRGHIYFNMIDSKVGSFAVTLSRACTINANGCVRNMKLDAQKNVEVSIKGYDGDIDLNKNGHKVFIDRD